MGIISIQQGRGTFVKSIDVGIFMSPFLPLIDFDNFDVTTIYDARLYLETGTCRLAAQNRTIEDVSHLKNYLNQMKDYYKTGNYPDLVEIDTRFHVKIAEISGNQLLKASVINLERISQACAARLNRTYSVMDEAIEQHEKITLAIEMQDADAAEKAIVEHTLLAKKHRLS
jgi:GntR family transcriptional repressor for pyruvate dehydrogenase complex